VLEDDIARLLEGGVEHDPRPGLPDEARQCALALLKWRAAEVEPVKLKEIKGAQRYHAIVAALAQELERGEPVFRIGDRLPVDQARARPERGHGLYDQREASRPVDPIAGEQPHAGAVAARHQPIAVVLDLVYLAGATRGFLLPSVDRGAPLSVGNSAL